MKSLTIRKTIRVADLQLMDFDIVECKKENLLWNIVYDSIFNEHMYGNIPFSGVFIYRVDLKLVNLDKENQLLDICLIVDYDLVSTFNEDREENE